MIYNWVLAIYNSTIFKLTSNIAVQWPCPSSKISHFQPCLKDWFTQLHQKLSLFLGTLIFPLSPTLYFSPPLCAFSSPFFTPSDLTGDLYNLQTHSCVKVPTLTKGYYSPWLIHPRLQKAEKRRRRREEKHQSMRYVLKYTGTQKPILLYNRLYLTKFNKPGHDEKREEENIRTGKAGQKLLLSQ